MPKIVKVRNIENITPEKLMKLAKDQDTVYIMYNVWSSMDELYKRANIDRPDYEECWRVKPLYKFVKNKEPDWIEVFCSRIWHGKITLFRIRD
jgi:hypothetical protein